MNQLDIKRPATYCEDCDTQLPSNKSPYYCTYCKCTVEVYIK